MLSNLILFDWCNFTTVKFSAEELMWELGLNECSWELNPGTKGYAYRFYFNGISIHHGGDKHDDVWVEMSGSGCRAFETYGHGDWQRLFSFLRANGCNLTRLDVSYDEHEGLLDMRTIVRDTYNQEYVSRARSWSTECSNKGFTAYVGSKQSDVLIRIYDKAAERHCDSGVHWIRVELQLRGSRAWAFLDLPGALGDNFAGVLANYLRYVDPDPDDSNRWRWPVKDYWAQLLAGASAISIFTAPGVEYNLDRCEDYVYRQAGNAIDCLIQIYGVDRFMERLKERNVFMSDKYKHLIQAYKGF